MFFSFKEGRPIGLIMEVVKKKLTKKLVYIDKDDGLSLNRRIDLVLDNMSSKGVSKRDIKLIKTAIQNEGDQDAFLRLTNEYLRMLYYKSLDDIKNFKQKHIKIESGEIIPVPNIETREILYICGPSGSGKSVFASKYIDRYTKLFNKNKVYIFSRVKDDPAFADLKNVEYISLDEQLLSIPIDAQIYKDSLVVMDDIDTEPNKAIQDYLEKVKSELLETGRHTNTYMVITSHLVTNYKKTRTMMNEFHCLVIFPGSGSSQQIKYALDRYFGLNFKAVNEMIKKTNNSRWILLNKRAPQYAMYDRGIFFLNEI